MELHEAAILLDVAESTLQAFSVPDTFNGGQVIEGFLSQQSDHRYGALVIYRVAGLDTNPQIIYCTPKMHYPFDRSDGDRHYKFPKAVRIEVYTKWDGTNVNCYSYKDASGSRFVSFKTRLVPVLQESKWGSFKAMWEELLAGSSDLRDAVEIVRAGNVTLSFEMYGYRNPHMISYPVALETKLLFAVRQSDAAVLPPWLVVGSSDIEAKAEAVIDSTTNLVAFYEAKRAEADTKNKRVTEGDVERVDGTEGYIFYVLGTTGAWSQWKCKSSTIEAIHWSGDFIPDSIIYPTATNALESCEGELTVEYVKKLLLEEFKQTQVDNSTSRIEKILADIKHKILWQEQVKTAYEATGLDFARDGKKLVMQALAKQFPRNEMGSVYTALHAQGLV